MDGGVTFLRVTVDLSAHTGQTYKRRIVAAWVQPSPDNWGLEQWKLGIQSLRVFEDHDFGSDGDWVFWAAINNRDQEWTQLLDEDSVSEGTYTFGGRPWETGSAQDDRCLGPHVLLFNPDFCQYFPGQQLRDLTRSLEVHTSGYEAEFWDDEVGRVNDINRPDAATLPVGARMTLTRRSSTGDYELNYFYERVGPVAGANLTAAGQSLAAAYAFGATGRCTSIRPNLCVALPETAPAEAWDPSQESTSPGAAEFNWHAHSIFKRQEPEPFSLTDMPLDQLGRAVSSMLQRDPAGAQRFFTELREEFDEVRGTAIESEYVQALPAFERHLPAAEWQRHFGDITLLSRFAYALADSPTAASYTPDGQYAYNSSGGGISITRQGVGIYDVVFDNLPAWGINLSSAVAVTAYGSSTITCSVVTYSTSPSRAVAKVACFNVGTKLVADSRFTIMVVGNQSVLPPSAFVMSGGPAPVPPPNPAWAWTSGRNPCAPLTVTHNAAPGDYNVLLGTGNTPKSAKLVTGTTGGGTRCKYAQGISGGLQVRCYDWTGIATDQGFSVVQVAGGRPGRRIGFAFANLMTTASYTPNPIAAFNSSGGVITATRSSVGHYAMNFAGLQKLTGHTEHVQVTSFGATLSTCNVVSWGNSTDGLKVFVECRNGAGQFMDSRYNVLVIE